MKWLRGSGSEVTEGDVAPLRVAAAAGNSAARQCERCRMMNHPPTTRRRAKRTSVILVLSWILPSSSRSGPPQPYASRHQERGIWGNRPSPARLRPSAPNRRLALRCSWFVSRLLLRLRLRFDSSCESGPCRYRFHPMHGETPRKGCKQNSTHRRRTVSRFRISSSISSGRATVWAISSRNISRCLRRSRCTADLTVPTARPSRAPISA